MKETLNIGVVGCGDISNTYLDLCGNFPVLNLLACSDLDLENAQIKADRYGLKKVYSTKELLEDPQIDIVLNLTPPEAHAPVNLAALEAGKHVYCEKPLAINRAQGEILLKLAEDHDLRIGCAPDTFLGAGCQTALELVTRGAIGEPVSATAFMVCHGHEHWHPNPEFYYQPGGGPLFDMGPYYLTTLCAILGPVVSVTGLAQAGLAEREVRSGPYKGRRIPVNTPTHITATLKFTGNLLATLIMSFDVWAHNLPMLEIHGTEGSLSLPDPNTFGGPLRLFEPEEESWCDISITRPYFENTRGLGLADLAHALLSGRDHRARGDMAFHVLDIMESILQSSKTGKEVNLSSTMDRPAPMETDLPEWILES